MSPEQVAGKLDAIGPASDVYALGATLYALLTGGLAYAAKDRRELLDAVQSGRVIPPREQLPSIPKPLAAICLKAMRLKPEDRYAGARASADDVEHCLADEPVSAWREPIAVRARRWTRKHQAVVSTATAVLMLSAVGAGLVALQQNAHARAIGQKNQALAAQTQKAEAQTIKAEARELMAIDAVTQYRNAVADNEVLKGSPSLQELRKTLLKTPLDFFKKLRDELQKENDTRPESLQRLAEATFELGDLTRQIGNKQDALAACQDSLAIRERLARENPTLTAYQDVLASNHNDVGILLYETGKPAEALAAYERALAIHERLARERPTVAEFQNHLAKHHNNIGLLLRETGKPAEALAAFRQAIAFQERMVRENPSVTEYQSDLGKHHANIAALLDDAGKPDQALAALEESLAIRERLVRENPTVADFQIGLARCHASIGDLLRKAGKLADALQAYERAIGIQERLARENPSVTELQSVLGGSHNKIALLFRETGRLAEAIAALEKSLAIAERLARENPSVAQFQNSVGSSQANLGSLLREIGKPAEALAAYEKALAVNERLAREHPEAPLHASKMGASLNNMAAIDLDENRFAAAGDRLKQAIQWQKKALAANPNHPTYRQFLTNHYDNLKAVAVGLGDLQLAAEAQQGLDELSGRPGASAFAALDQRLTAVLGGEPANNAAEQIALGQRAYNTFRFAAAARLWSDALASDPALAEDRESQHAYNAACAAALAGAGQGKDDPKPDDAAKTRFREQAPAWLQAELDAWSKLLDSATPDQREAIANTVTKTLTRWQETSDLAWFRGDKIETLPAAERDAWRTLWRRVDELLAQAQTPAS
jgi:eukaryotic-like serine/threonine-protein kinase